MQNQPEDITPPPVPQPTPLAPEPPVKPVISESVKAELASLEPSKREPVKQKPSTSEDSDTEALDTEAEALAKKFAKSRVENLNLTHLPTEEEKRSKRILIISLVTAFVLLIGGAAAYYFLVHKPEQERLAEIARAEAEAAAKKAAEEIPLEEAVKEPEVPKFYSILSGEEIATEADNSKPTFCVQIPNGADGARPQAGLQNAKIVFEAIAESGITRFAAIYQDPPAIIGPIRSLRIYYLNWDVPFDCTVVHDGGSDEAIQALKSYGMRELDEDRNYMWRSSVNYTVQRAWNNVFTSGEYLNNFNNANGYLSSDIKSFPRFTPSGAARNKIDVQIIERLKIDTPSTTDTSVMAPKITKISLSFGVVPNFNPIYNYDSTTNTYKRSYATGSPHNSYNCDGKTSEITPELVCEEEQLAPSVVIAMIVQEKKASYDNYHEDIATIGAGDAYIFQNGTAIVGTWEKSSKDAQIIFRDSAGEEVKLIPGQVWISAIPASYYGAGVSYE